MTVASRAEQAYFASKTRGGAGCAHFEQTSKAVTRLPSRLNMNSAVGKSTTMKPSGRTLSQLCGSRKVAGGVSTVLGPETVSSKVRHSQHHVPHSVLARLRTSRSRELF